MTALLTRIFLAALALATTAAALQLKSPDGQVVVRFDLKAHGELPACPVYSVSYHGRAVLADSWLGLELRAGSLASGMRITGQQSRTRDTTWQPVAGELQSIRDHCNEVVVDLQEIRPPLRRVQVTLRAYDEGLAFCYTLPVQAGLTDFVITRERTQFAFAGDYTAWAVYNAQGNYDPAAARRKGKLPACGPVPLSQIQPGVERPLTVRVESQLYAAITEARLVDCARMKLRATAGAAHTLEASLDGEVTGRAPFTLSLIHI